MKPQPPPLPQQQEEAAETNPSTFAFSITRIASAQICQSVGFTSAHLSALNTLTDVAATYLRALASSAAASSSSSNRTHSNLLDVSRALENLTSVHGFPGAWNIHRSPLASPTLLHLSDFVAQTDEIPFAKPLPRPSTERAVFTVNSMGVSHVPRWLPAFPEMGRVEIDGSYRSKYENSFEPLIAAMNGGSDCGLSTISQFGEERGWDVGLCGEVDGGCLVGGERMKMGLLEKRGRVRFKMGFGVGRGRGKGKGRGEVGEGLGQRGSPDFNSEVALENNGLVGVDLRSGVCRGGKRVSCHQSRNVNDEKEKKRRKKRSSDVPRKRRGATTSGGVAPPK